MIVPLSIGDSIPFSVTLDTGMTFPGVHLFHRDAAAEINLGDMMEVLVPGATQSFPSNGVAGYTFFGAQAVGIDYDKLTISLYEPGTLEPDSAWTALPFSLRRGIPFLEIQVAVSAGPPAHGRIGRVARPSSRFVSARRAASSSHCGRRLEADHRKCRMKPAGHVHPIHPKLPTRCGGGGPCVHSHR